MRNRIILIFLLFSIIFCLFTASFIIGIPKRAAENFGNPNPDLSFMQILRHSWILNTQKEELENGPTSDILLIEFEISFGDSARQVVNNLSSTGLISDPSLFTTYLVYTGIDTRLQTGIFQLNTAMSPITIAEIIQDRNQAYAYFTVVNGWRLEEVADALPASGLYITPADFLAEVQSLPDTYVFSESLPDNITAEGFLFPSRFAFPRTITTETFINRYLSAFESHLSVEMINGFYSQGLSLYEAVTLASIIEREAVHDDEKPMIASVYLNRLAINMMLQADPTVQYALGNAETGWWKSQITFSDLETQSPYNTYQVHGLPPSPIANPNLASLMAVAFPAESPYYFFRAACDGSHYHRFSVTYQEHLDNACP